jgi:hypothetical protein
LAWEQGWVSGCANFNGEVKISAYLLGAFPSELVEGFIALDDFKIFQISGANYFNHVFE